MEPIKFFDSMDYLEPKCPGCAAKIEYGLTTQWSDEHEAHTCKTCGAVLR